MEFDIMKREINKSSQTVLYYLHDPSLSQSQKVIVEGVTSSYEPLKSLRHCYAKIEKVEGSDVNKLIGILTDSDWIERKA